MAQLCAGVHPSPHQPEKHACRRSGKRSDLLLSAFEPLMIYFLFGHHTDKRHREELRSSSKCWDGVKIKIQILLFVVVGG